MIGNNKVPHLSLDIKSFSFLPEGSPVLKDISFSINAGELVGVMGANGSGKSTFLYLCAGELSAQQVKRKIASGLNEIAFVYQDYRQSLFPWKTAISNICLPGIIRGQNKDDVRKKADELIKNFELEFDLNKLPSHLSGGEQQKISVLRSLLELPKLFLMDEPCSAMDYVSRLIFLKNLRKQLKVRKTATIMVSHSAEEAFLFCDRLILFSDEGTIADAISDCQSQENYLQNIRKVHEHFLSKNNKVPIC